MQQPIDNSPRRSVQPPSSTLHRSGGPNPRRAAQSVTQKSFAPHHLPDIVKRGPINNNKGGPSKKIVGLSLQRKEDREPAGGKFVRDKRISLNDNTKTYRNSKARDELLNAQRKPPQSGVQKKKSPTYRMPPRNGSLQARNAASHQRLTVDNSKSSISPIRKSNALKPLINNRAWIPGGHANSVGRNKLASHGTKFNLQYRDTTKLAPDASVSKLSYYP